MASDVGLEMLIHSVRRFRVVYPEFDCVVCCNNTPDQQLNAIKKLNVNIHYQDEHSLGYPLEPPSSPPGWKGMWPHLGIKLCPPRLNIFGHELWVDNDIVIRGRLPTVDMWLKSKKCIIAQGHGRRYDHFESHIPEGVVCSGGFFGVSPGFDLGSKVLHECRHVLQGEPLAYYDEQGLVTKVMTESPHFLVPMEEVYIVKKLPDKPLPPALHFIGANRLKEDKNWLRYKSYSSML